MSLVATGTAPQTLQTWKQAVFVPKEYFETRDGSDTSTTRDPVGQDVQTPPRFTQNVQEHALAGISFGSGCQSSMRETFPQ
jgi:hypothetical protein